MRRTTKQIAERYRGNLDYFRKPHYLRSLRTWAFILAVIASLAFAFGYQKMVGKPEFYNTGPLSDNHKQFQNRCEVCHTDAQPDLAKVLKFDRAVSASTGGGKSGAEKDDYQLVNNLLKKGGVTGAVEDLANKYQETAALSKMDQACLQCHDSYKLHQPQASALTLRPVYRELSVVHGTSCAVCHREHHGPQKMKLPGDESCESCHNDSKRLDETLNLVKLGGQFAARTAQIRDLGDGVKRFLPPREVPHKPVAFKSFAEGHPPFGYEKPGLKDPAAIKYNHLRHEQPDIPPFRGAKLDCSTCHKLGADSLFFQPVDFETHCVDCHSLHFDPDVPDLKIPHGDPVKVRDFISSLTAQYRDYAALKLGMTDPAQRTQYVEQQYAKLANRGITGPAEIERRVFHVGDPPEVPGRVTARSNKGQFYTGCAKCHEVSPLQIAAAPTIKPTNMASRWLTRGPFTHAEHGHMSCLECHGAAKDSKLTTDILMPSQQSCIPCHRPLEQDKVETLKSGSPADLNAKQRREGGIAADCRSCHQFHAPNEAIDIIARAQP